MPKPLLLLLGLLLAGLLRPSESQAAPGDTTRVVVFNQRKLTHYGYYDTTATLPPAGRRYRKVLLHYILGRYPCPPGTQYCGSWDYTTRLLLMPAAHDTVEMARIITPYATDWLTRNKTHDYVVDVSDYAPLLTGSRSMRFDYQGYSWGFNVTLRLDFIEGTPPQDPVDVRNAYQGTFAYGKTSDPIDSHLPARPVTTPLTGTLTLKNLISGHGSDPAGCSEFCVRYYDLLVNGQARAQTYLWRDDCGRNEVYPQTGTWVYNRGNWCPGAIVKPLLHPLTGYATPGGSLTLDLNMQPYTASNQASASAQYIWSSQLVTAGPVNFQTDAAIEEIVAPNSNENYFRENPSCGGPQLRLRNLGSSPLTQATISYGVPGRGTPLTYAWTGRLPYGRDTLLTLPPLSPQTISTGGRFRAWVSAPNASADQNRYNDTLSTRFAATMTLPANSVVSLTTNNNGSQTTWDLLDVAGNVLARRRPFISMRTYNDTLRLQAGCYSLRVSDTGCDGLSWWANPSGGTGSLRLLDVRTGGVLRTIDGDFGCEYTLNFRVLGTGSGTTAPGLVAAFDVYPNPSADGRFTLDLNLPVRQSVRLGVADALGRQVWSRALGEVKAATPSLDLHHLAPGVYDLGVTLADGSVLHRRLVVE